MLIKASGSPAEDFRPAVRSPVPTPGMLNASGSPAEDLEPCPVPRAEDFLGLSFLGDTLGSPGGTELGVSSLDFRFRKGRALADSSHFFSSPQEAQVVQG